MFIWGIGLVFWCLFYRGYPNAQYGDWVKENIYLDVIRDAIVHQRLPLEYFISIKPDYQRFFAIPEICLTPDIFLLPYLTNNQFFLFHTIIFFTIGNIGIYKFSKNWQFLPKVLLSVLFNFNGFILNHLAAGHFQFIGYFTFSAFFWLLIQLLAANTYRESIYRSIQISIILGINILNGSIHTAIWMYLLVGAVILLVKKIHGISLALALLISIALGACRVIPSVVFFPPLSGFITGYPSVTTLLESLTISHGPTYTVQLGDGTSLGWWEFDFFIGITATILIVLMSKPVLYCKNLIIPRPILISCLIVFILSIGDLYGIVSQFPISSLKAERISTRFIALPMVAFVIIIASELDKVRIFRSYIGYVVVLLIILELSYNTTHYLKNAQNKIDSSTIFYFVNGGELESFYPVIVKASLIISILSIIILSCYLLTKKYRRRSEKMSAV